MGNDQSNNSGKKTSPNTYHPDIVVVSEKNDKNNLIGYNIDDNEAKRLQYIPLFYPIIKSSIGIKEDQNLLEIDPESVTKLCNRIQTHLNLCADTVTRDQNALNTRIKEIDFVTNTLMHSYTERQRKYAKYCEQFLAVKEISNNIKKVQRNIDGILPMLDEINNMLPQNERLEKFSLSDK